MPIRLGVGPAVLFAFSCIGVYMAAARHATARLFAQKFYIFLLLYVIWSLSLILWRDEPLSSNRQIGYTALIALTAFAGPGMVLIRQPLRAYVLGSRIGVLIATAVSLYLNWTPLAFSQIRVGIGNEAVFAFIVAVAAIAAIQDIRSAPKVLPNGPFWLLIGLIPIGLSQTRAVLAIVVVIAAFEVVRYVSHMDFRRQALAYAGLGFAVVILAAPLQQIATLRFTGIAEYLGTGDSSQIIDHSSADIREDLWRGARAVIFDHPVTGVGSYSKMDLVRDVAAGEAAFDLRPFQHVHNMILDELLNDGIVGLFLLGAAFFALFAYLWRVFRRWALRRALIYFSLVWFSYGMFHNPLLHEVTISAIMLFVGVLNAEASRILLRRARKCVKEGVTSSI